MTNIATPSVRGFRLAAVLGWFCVFPILGWTANFQARWSEIPSLVSGREVTVSLPGGSVVMGEVMSVGSDSLTMDVRKVSGGRNAHTGLMTIPRTSVSHLRATKMTSAWGRRLGVILGQASGAVGGVEFAYHCGNSEAGGVTSFLAIYAGATVAGYYVGKAHDRHAVEIEILHGPPSIDSSEPGTLGDRPGLAPRGDGK